MVAQGLNTGKEGSPCGGQRVKAEQLGTEAAPGQSKPEEGGGPGWAQQAGGRQGESTERAPGESGSQGEVQGAPRGESHVGRYESPVSTSPG